MVVELVSLLVVRTWRSPQLSLAEEQQQSVSELLLLLLIFPSLCFSFPLQFVSHFQLLGVVLFAGDPLGEAPSEEAL